MEKQLAYRDVVALLLVGFGMGFVVTFGVLMVVLP
jgi:hypothetical protein